MTGKKIVVGFDGSENSKRALAIAVNLAQPLTAAVYIATIWDATAKLTLDEISSIDHDKLEVAYKEVYTKVSDNAKLYCQERGVEAYTKVLQGNPAQEIIKYAEENNACMIVAGTRGLGGFEKLLLGSVAHNLINYSSIPVLIVK